MEPAGSPRIRLIALGAAVLMVLSAPALGANGDPRPKRTTVTFNEERFPPSGKVLSPSTKCVNDRKVTFWAQRFGGSREKQGTDRADRQGRWRVPVEAGSFPPDTIKIYAEVDPISRGGRHPFACKGDQSNKLSIGN